MAYSSSQLSCNCWHPVFGIRDRTEHRRCSLGNLRCLRGYSEKLAVLQRQSSLDQIENGDQLVLFAYAAIVFNNAESVYLHHRAGSVDEDVFLARMGSFISYFDTVPIMKEVWNQGIGAETPEFVSYIESRVRGLNRPSESLTR